MGNYIVVHSVKVATEFVPETFGRLTTVGPKFLLPRKGTRGHQVCQCECGCLLVVNCKSLLSGNSKSCGCARVEATKKSNTKHGMCGTVEYTSWSNMIQRCTKLDNKSFRNYGGRGITVCERWSNPENGFSNFLADMGPKPTPKHEIERKMVNDNYEPSNCHWSTRLEQARNKRSNRLLEHNGKTQCVSAWAEELGVFANTLYARLSGGWSTEKTLTTPVLKKTTSQN